MSQSSNMGDFLKSQIPFWILFINKTRGVGDSDYYDKIVDSELNISTSFANLLSQGDSFLTHV